jgi:hypothetical protein
MKISCSSCNTIYNIDETKLSDKILKTKCKKCNCEIIIRRVLEEQEKREAPIDLLEINNTISTKQYKKCPYCAEDVQLLAIKCKHCGSMIDESGHVSQNNDDEMQVVEDKSSEVSGLQYLTKLIDGMINIEAIREKLSDLQNTSNLSKKELCNCFIEKFIEDTDIKKSKNGFIKYIPVIGNITNSALNIYSDVNHRSTQISNFLLTIAAISMTYDENISSSDEMCIPVIKTVSYAVNPVIAKEIPLDGEALDYFFENFGEIVKKVTEKLFLEVGSKVTSNLLGAIPIAGGLLKRGYDIKVKGPNLLDSSYLYRLIDDYEELYAPSTHEENENEPISDFCQTSSIYKVLSENLKHRDKIYFAESMDDEREKNIRGGLRIPDRHQLLCFLDGSVFGSCKAGVAFTDTGIFFKSPFVETRFLSYEEFFHSSINFKRTIFDDTKINISINGNDLDIELIDSDNLLALYDALCKLKSNISPKNQNVEKKSYDSYKEIILNQECAKAGSSGLITRQYRDDQYVSECSISCEPKEAEKVVSITLSAIGSIQDSSALESQNIVIASVIKSGWMEMNPCLVMVEIDSGSDKTSNLVITGVAKEGLINQNTAQKAVKKVLKAIQSANIINR